MNLKFQSTGPALAPISNEQQNAKLRQVASDLEASFLAEMLKEAGLGQARDAFGGGAGEEHFSSFMVEAQAKELVRSGGIGLAEFIFESLKEKQNANTQSN